MVALVVVALIPVKFWRVDEPRTSIVAKLFVPEKVLLSANKVEEAAPAREVRHPVQVRARVPPSGIVPAPPRGEAVVTTIELF